MQYLVAKAPDGAEQRLPAQVTRVYPDGRFDVRSTDGLMSIISASPDSIRLEDENGNAIEPIVEKTTEEKHDIRLQAAESALLFLMDMNMGGMS